MILSVLLTYYTVSFQKITWIIFSERWNIFLFPCFSLYVMQRFIFTNTSIPLQYIFSCQQPVLLWHSHMIRIFRKSRTGYPTQPVTQLTTVSGNFSGCFCDILQIYIQILYDIIPVNRMISEGILMKYKGKKQPKQKSPFSGRQKTV